MRLWGTKKGTYTREDKYLAIIRSILDYKSQFRARNIKRDLNLDSRFISSYLRTLIKGDLKGLIEIDDSSMISMYIIKDKEGIKKVYDRLYEQNAQKKSK